LIALVLTTKNKETKHYIHATHKKPTQKPAVANTKSKSWFGMTFMSLGREMEWAYSYPERGWGYI